MRYALVVSGLILMVLGLGCLNFTTDGKAVQHREWAREHGFPEPSNAIYLLGLGCTAGGAGAVGFVLGRRRARP